MNLAGVLAPYRSRSVHLVLLLAPLQWENTVLLFIIFYLCPSELPLIATSWGRLDKLFQRRVWKCNKDQCSTHDSKPHRFLLLLRLFFDVCCHVMKLEPLVSYIDDLRYLWVCTPAIVVSLPSPMACQNFDKRSCRELVGWLKLAHEQKIE